MSKFIFAFAIFLLLLSVASIVTHHQGFSIKILIICFWVLLAGCLTYLFETNYEK